MTAPENPKRGFLHFFRFLKRSRPKKPQVEVATIKDSEPSDELVVPEGATLELAVAQVAPPAEGEEAKKGCAIKGGGEHPHGTTATVIFTEPDGTQRTKVHRCNDGEWEKISDTTTHPKIGEDLDLTIETPEAGPLTDD